MRHSALRAIACAGSMLIFGGLAGCSYDVQTTSGRAYLDKYPALAAGAKGPGAADKASGATAPAESIDAKVRRVAAVEPVLRFPARIGLARIANGKLSPIPAKEAAAWFETAKKLGTDFGDLVPVNRLIAEMVTRHTYQTSQDGIRRSDPTSRLRRVMEKIRLGSARQHLDAVLVYEVYGESDTAWNPFAIFDFTIIGGFILPGESIEAEGFATALLLDVRNGYPYGTARKVVKKQTMAPSFDSTSIERKTLRDAKVRAAIALAPEVEKMMRKLRQELQVRRASRSGRTPVASAPAPGKRQPE